MISLNNQMGLIRAEIYYVRIYAHIRTRTQTHIYIRAYTPPENLTNLLHRSERSTGEASDKYNSHHAFLLPSAECCH